MLATWPIIPRGNIPNRTALTNEMRAGSFRTSKHHFVGAASTADKSVVANAAFTPPSIVYRERRKTLLTAVVSAIPPSALFFLRVSTARATWRYSILIILRH